MKCSRLKIVLSGCMLLCGMGKVGALYGVEKNNEDTLKLKDGANIIKCHNCGASIDATKGSCEHCGTKIKYLQEWILVDSK